MGKTTDLDTILLILGGIFTIKFILPIFMDAYSYAAAIDPKIATLRTDTQNPAPSSHLQPPKGATGPSPWDCITHKERLKVIKDPVTVTGVVIAAGDGGPHYAPDGDLVFAFKPDDASLLNDKNISNKKYDGGLWVEGVCQKPNKAKEARHQGDCAAGCGAPKLTAPKVGDKLRITGAHVSDVGEDGHNEIHPVYTIEKI